MANVKGESRKLEVKGLLATIINKDAGIYLMLPFCCSLNWKVFKVENLH